jgi:metal-dependent amidase/aminoacylase/carboxypeptidase family protein
MFPGFAVAGTVASIRRYLEEHAGISKDVMVDCAENGLVVTLQGTGIEAGGVTAVQSPAHDLPTVLTVALRADTDALPMTEGNHHLPYRSQNEGVAHMYANPTTTKSERSNS